VAQSKEFADYQALTVLVNGKPVKALKKKDTRKLKEVTLQESLQSIQKTYPAKEKIYVIINQTPAVPRYVNTTNTYGLNYDSDEDEESTVSIDNTYGTGNIKKIKSYEDVNIIFDIIVNISTTYMYDFSKFPDADALS